MTAAPRSTFKRLFDASERHGAAFAVLIDPEKQPTESLDQLVKTCEEAGVDFLLIGGSSLQDIDFEAFAYRVKSSTVLPVVGFPGSMRQIAPSLDAVLYLSIVSGRNPDYLIGRHVEVAPRIHKLGLESIATAYILVDSGAETSVQRVTATQPLPRQNLQLVADTALAAEMMGMQLIYLEAGSGALNPVPIEMISAVTAVCSAPVMVGGGLRKPADVEERARAGARFIVIGNAIEKRQDRTYLSELAAAAHVL